MNVKPYDLYIRFLVTKGATSLEEVNNSLERLALPPVDYENFEKQYNLVQDALPSPILRQIEVQNFTPDFIKWMKVLEVEELWYFEKPFWSKDSSHLRLVYDIHSDLQLRLTLNALLLKSHDFNELSQEVNMKFATMLKPLQIEIYKKFFWRIESMTRKAWKEYLKECDENERSTLFTAFTEPLHILKTVLDLPTKANLSESLQYLFVQSYRKARFYLQLDNPAANSMAIEWIKATMQLADKYEKHSQGDVQDFGKTLQMEFDFIDTEFPTPDQETMKELQEQLQDKQKKQTEEEINDAES